MEIEEIYMLFYGKDIERTRSLDDLIKLFETHQSKIESSNTKFSDRLLFNYSLDLAKNEEYNRAIPYLEKSISTVSNPAYENNILNRESYFKELRLMKAVSFYYTKKIKESKAVFNQLYKDYPNNDTYKDWLKSSIHWRYQQLSNYLWGVAGICFLLEFFFSRIFKSNWNELFLFVGILSMATIGILYLISKFNQKKIK